MIGGDRTRGAGPNGESNLMRADHDGIVISGSGTSDNVVIGNYLGDLSGQCLTIAAGATANRVGSTVPGERNIVGGCGPAGGILITGRGTTGNVVIGTYMGVGISGDARPCSPACGSTALLTISDRATRNRIGGTAPGERNVISGGGGVSVAGLGTMDNLIVGNYIGTDAAGTRAVPNTSFGIWLDGGASRTRIEGNLISGNKGAAAAISRDYSVVLGNLFGTDASGKAALGGGGGFYAPDQRARFTRIGGAAPGEANVIAGGDQGPPVWLDAPGTEQNYIIGNLIGTDVTGAALPAGGPFFIGPAITLSDGVKRNVVGGSTASEANVIAGSPDSGISFMGAGVSANSVLGSWIGASQAGAAPIGNRRNGIEVMGADHTFILGNRIASNTGNGVTNNAGLATTVRANSIHDNGGGIYVQMSPATAVPLIGSVASNSVSGTACANCLVEIFSDAGSQGGYFEGSVHATAGGVFTLVKPGGFQGPHVTATATDANGLTSPFSLPIDKPGP